MNKIKTLLCALFLVVVTEVTAQEDTFFAILTDELKREQAEFAKFEQHPYFISYRVIDMRITELKASFGSLVESQGNKGRILTTSVRVGDYQLDNTHPVSDRNGEFAGMPEGRATSLAIDNVRESIQYALWQATKSDFRQAREALKAVNNSPTKLKYKRADFSKEIPRQYHEKIVAEEPFNQKEWENKLRTYSQPFQQQRDFVGGDVSLKVVNERSYFVTSEGTSIVQNHRYAYLYLNGSVRSTDGDIVPLHRSFFSFTPAGLPPDQNVLQEVSSLISKLKELQKAPLAEPYTGPAILFAPAAGVFFHEIFGHRVEGHRLRNEMDGQTFKEKINQPVLAKTLSVVFDPTLSTFNGKALNGYYQYDDEGVKAQRVQVVDKGILKNFLMSRRPLEGFPVSNGHGRAAPGADPVSRQSNLIVETSKPVTFQELRKMLITEARKQGKKYGYFFKDVVGGFTTTDRYNPNAFNIFPTEVYRIYTDGRPDELVRGVDLIGTPLAMFAEILAASDQTDMFTGFCGAESGSVPVSAVSPSLFVRRIETQKKPQTDIEPTVLKSPTAKDEN